MACLVLACQTGMRIVLDVWQRVGGGGGKRLETWHRTAVGEILD